jgi:putative ABC transport system permease protein
MRRLGQSGLLDLFRDLFRPKAKFRPLPWEYGVRNLLRSPLRLMLSILGSGLVVLLVITSGGFVRGLDAALGSSGGKQNVMLVSIGSEESIERSEIRWSVTEEAITGISSESQTGLEAIRQTQGVYYVSPEIYLMTVFREPETSGPGNSSSGQPADGGKELRVQLRGVEKEAFLVHDNVTMIDGHAPRSGSNELIIGRLAATRMGTDQEQLAIGKTLIMDNQTWTIVGHFAAPGSMLETEVWCDLNALKVSSQREGLSMVVLTMDKGTLDDAKAFCSLRLELELTAMTEQSYYATLNKFYKPIRILVWATAILIALGGIFGGLNTMYAAFASRIREIGSLQAIGFSRRAVVLSLIQESVLAATIGSLIAAGLGMLLLDGIAVQFSTGAFLLVIDSTVITAAILTGLLLGVIGAIPPSIRCLRLPIPEALRA